MPSMAPMTVKNKANADVVFTPATPSAGDRSPAVWRANADEPYISRRPQFSVLSRDNGKRNARHFSFTYRHPVKVTENSVTTVAATVPMTVELVVPTNVSSAAVADAFYIAGNLLVQSLIRDAVEEGYAPT